MSGSAEVGKSGDSVRIHMSTKIFGQSMGLMLIALLQIAFCLCICWYSKCKKNKVNKKVK